MSNTTQTNGALLVMPLLVINLGAEMVFVLTQRLESQQIGEKKARRVIVDVVKSMFGDKFIKELFQPQKVYSFKSTRQIFDKLAHASVMRLNKQSMDKLYDLMVMMFKYQMLSCTAPDMIYAVTARHLFSIQDMVKESASCSLLVDSCIDLFIESYKKMKLSQWTMIRNIIAGFLQGSRTRISLLLNAKLQSEGGTIAIPITGHLPRNAVPPGAIRVYRSNALIMEDRVNHRPPPPVDIDNVFQADSIASAIYVKKFMGCSSNNNSSRNSVGSAGSGGGGGETEVQHLLFEGYQDDSPIAPGFSVYKNAPQVQSLLKKSSFLRSISVGDLLHKDPNASPTSGPSRTPSFRRVGSSRLGMVSSAASVSSMGSGGSGGSGGGVSAFSSPPHNPRSRENSECGYQDQSDAEANLAMKTSDMIFKDGDFRRTCESKDFDDFELEGRSLGNMSGGGEVGISSASAHIKETSLLSNLLGNNQSASSSDAFTLNLFENDYDDLRGNALLLSRTNSAGSTSSTSSLINTSMIDGSMGRKESYSKMIDDFGFGDIDEKPPPRGFAESKYSHQEVKDFLDDDEDDLLDLMDSVAK